MEVIPLIDVNSTESESPFAFFSLSLKSPISPKSRVSELPYHLSAPHFPSTKK